MLLSCSLPNSTNHLFEAGLFDESMQSSNDALIANIRRHARLFESKEEYTDAYSSSNPSGVTFKNFENALRFFFASQLLILSTFVLTKNAPHLFRYIASLLCEPVYQLERACRKFRRKFRR